jgi:hypothetical protein
MTNLKYLERLRVKAKVPVWIVAAQFGVTAAAYYGWLNNRTAMDPRYAEDGDRIEKKLAELLAGKILPLLTCGTTLKERHQHLQELLKGI